MSAVPAAPVRPVFERLDYWRRSPAGIGGRAGHKEWSYFCVLAEHVDVLVNFSLMDSLAGGRTTLDVARVALLVCEDGDRWEGDVDRYEPADVHAPAGRVAARFGPNTLGVDTGEYRIQARLRRRPVSVDLRMRPLLNPAVASSVRLSERGAMRWLVVPRLVATGWVEVDGRRHVLDSCLAYHDRNWGYFEWGADFAWEWAAILPVDPAVPWSIVYMRISDRSRNRVHAQSVIVWRNDVPWKTFLGRDMAVMERGVRRPAAVLRIPRVMSLALPGSAVDVPRRLDVESSSGADRLSLSLELESLAQIGMPNDSGAGVTVLSEARGRARVAGRIRGEDVDYDARVLAELNHAGG